jgi:hypothetical protein
MIIAHLRASFAQAFVPRLSEWTPAAVIAALGWVLTINPDLMGAAVADGRGRGYELMLKLAPQHSWALSLMLFGGVRLAVLLINGAWRRSPLARAIAAFLACFLWTQIAISFAPTLGFAFTMAAGFLGMEIVNTFRAMRDARIVDDAYARRSRTDGHT